VDEAKRAAFGHLKFKSFDFLIYPPGQCTMIVEVKGRKFKGTSFAGLSGFDCWVTADDVAGLVRWQQLLGFGHRAAFVILTAGRFTNSRQTDISSLRSCWTITAGV
jgi:hypothetical protein